MYQQVYLKKRFSKKTNVWPIYQNFFCSSMITASENNIWKKVDIF